jgi:hypothetical protein
MANASFRKAGWLAAWALVWAASGGTLLAESSRPCAEDAKRLCAGVSGRGEVRRCLRSHESELSAACRERLAQLSQARSRTRAACREDLRKFCGDVEPGGGRVIACLREHESELSPACRGVVARARPPRGQ